MKHIFTLLVLIFFAWATYAEEKENFIVTVNEVDDVDVFFNTSEDEAILELAQQTTIIDNEENTYTVELNWSLIDYSPITPGNYSTLGTFELPEGVQQSVPETPLEVHATVTVLEPPVIVDIDIYDEAEDIEVPYGTTESEAKSQLASTVTISDSDGFEHAVYLYWSIEHYSGEVAATYQATGQFTLPFGVDQTDPEIETIVTAVVTVLNPKFSLSLGVNPEGSAFISGEGDYYEAEEIHVSTVPDEGWEFINWTYADSTVVSDSTEFTFIMPGEDVQLFANFLDVTSIHEPKTKNFTIFPNPASDYFNIVSGFVIDQLILYDIKGNRVYSSPINQREAFVPVKELKPGLFLIQVISQDVVTSQRIMIK